MGAPKAEKFPIQLMSLKAIKVDHALQSRVKMSLEDQRDFSEAMLRGDQFPPVTVFFDGKTHWLADGFHRHAAAIKAQLDSIRSEIRHGTKKDAIVFSAGANQKFSIKRTNADIAKALRMVFAFDEWWVKSDAAIAAHVGCSHSTVKNHRVNYCSEAGISLPETVVGMSGETLHYPTTKGEPTIYKKTLKRGFHEYNVRFKDMCRTANTEDEAKELAEEMKNWDFVRDGSLEIGQFFNFLTAHGVRAVQPSRKSGAGRNLLGLQISGCVIYPSPLGNKETVQSAVGNILLLRQVMGPLSKAVIVCYRANGDSQLIDVAEQLGIEFMTPEEVVAEFGPKDGETPATEPPADD